LRISTSIRFSKIHGDLGIYRPDGRRFLSSLELEAPAIAAEAEIELERDRAEREQERAEQERASGPIA
jgi:hypothetical protein